MPTAAERVAKALEDGQPIDPKDADELVRIERKYRQIKRVVGALTADD